MDVKKDVEDSGNIDGWDEKDLLLKSWISCNLKKTKNVHYCGLLKCLEETHHQAIKNKESHLNINHNVLVEEYKD